MLRAPWPYKCYTNTQHDGCNHNVTLWHVFPNFGIRDTIFVAFSVHLLSETCHLKSAQGLTSVAMSKIGIFCTPKPCRVVGVIGRIHLSLNISWAGHMRTRLPVTMRFVTQISYITWSSWRMDLPTRHPKLSLGKIWCARLTPSDWLVAAHLHQPASSCSSRSGETWTFHPWDWLTKNSSP